MNTKEIAKLCGTTERTIRRWIEIVTADKMSVIADKMSVSSPMRPADFTLEETICIIRSGGNDTLADLLMTTTLPNEQGLPLSNEKVNQSIEIKEIKEALCVVLAEINKLKESNAELKQIGYTKKLHRKPKTHKAKIISRFVSGPYHFARVEFMGKLLLITPNYLHAMKYNVTYDEGRNNSQPLNRTGILSEKQALKWIERNL